MNSIQKKAAYHHGDLRAQLVEAVRSLVEEKGPEKFSVSEACRAAGVSTAAPYKHFKDKQEMVIAVALDGMDRLRIGMEEAIRDHADGSAEAIAALGSVYVRFATAEPGVFRLMFGLTKAHGHHEGMKEMGMRCYGVVLNQVRLFMERDEVDGDVRVQSFALWSLVHGTSFLVIDDKVALDEFPISMDEHILACTRQLLGSG